MCKKVQISKLHFFVTLKRAIAHFQSGRLFNRAWGAAARGLGTVVVDIILAVVVGCIVVKGDLRKQNATPK